MNEQRKSIQSLTILLDEKRGTLSNTYYQFGEKLLADSVDPVILSGAVNSERLESWQALRASREADTRTVLDIKDALAREQELERFRKEILAQLNEENILYSNELSALGKALCDSYTSEDVAEFGDFYDKVASQQDELIKLEQKQEKMRRDIEQSGFFSKMFAQLKIAGVATTIRQFRSRLDRLFAVEARTLLENGTIDAKAEAAGPDSSLGVRFASAREVQNRIATLTQRDQAVFDDLAAVRAALDSYGASSNPSARISELRSSIKEADKKIDSLVVLTAREYTDKFLDENGRSLLGNTGDGHMFSDMGMYARQLEQIAVLRSDIWTIRQKIDVLETSLKIESLDKNISSYSRSVEEYTRKIEQYTEMIANLRKTIADAELDKEALVQHRISVEASLPRDARNEAASE